MTATAESAALSPSVARLRARFGDAILGAAVVCGDTIVHVANGQAELLRIGAAAGWH